MSLLCDLVDQLAWFDAVPTGRHHRTGRILRELPRGLFDKTPLARQAAQLAFSDRTEFEAHLKKVYKNYIVRYYRNMCGACRSVE